MHDLNQSSSTRSEQIKIITRILCVRIDKLSSDFVITNLQIARNVNFGRISVGVGIEQLVIRLTFLEIQSKLVIFAWNAQWMRFSDHSEFTEAVRANDAN